MYSNDIYDPIEYDNNIVKDLTTGVKVVKKYSNNLLNNFLDSGSNVMDALKKTTSTETFETGPSNNVNILWIFVIFLSAICISQYLYILQINSQFNTILHAVVKQ